jgi:hypothetical protein
METIKLSTDLFLPRQIIDILDINFIGDTTKTFYINGWSVLHFLSGVIIAIFFNKYKPVHPYLRAFAIHSIWELWTIAIGTSKPYTVVGKSNLIDILVDTLLFMIGFSIFYN